MPLQKKTIKIKYHCVFIAVINRFLVKCQNEAKDKLVMHHIYCPLFAVIE